MKAIERFVEARSTVEGKAVAVALTALLALSSFTPATLAVADEGEGSSDEMSLAVNDVAMPEGEDGFSAPNTPEEPDGVVENGEDAEEDSTDDTDDLGGTLTAGLAELEGEANDGATVRVQAPVGTTFPADAEVRVENALTDIVESALAQAIGEDQRLGTVRAYKVEIVDGEGNELADVRGAVAFLTSEGIPAFDATAFRMIGEGEAQKLNAPAGLVPELTAVAFPLETASGVYAFALIESANDEGAGQEETEGEAAENVEGSSPEPEAPAAPEQPATPEPEPGNAAVPEQPATDPESDEEAVPEPAPAPENESEPAPEAQSIVLYVGESRALSCSGLHVNHRWATSDTAVAAVRNTNAQRVTVDAVAPGTATVRCDTDAVYEITVKVAPATSEIAHFYFLPPTADGAAADLGQAQYMGSGVVNVPAGYDKVSQLVNGSVVGDRVIRLSDLIAEAPSDTEVRTGLAAYFNGSIDGAQNGTASKMKYDASWNYTYEPVVFTGKINSTGYNGTAVSPTAAHHIYVQMNIEVPEKHYTLSYAVQTPSGSEVRSILHSSGDAAVELNGYNDSATSLTVDGVTYPAVKTVGDTVKYHFDGWYTDTTFRTKAPRTYAEGVSATFYARYLSVGARTVSFDPMGGTFDDGTTEVKAVRADVGGAYWLLDAPKRFGYTFKGWRAKGSESLHDAGKSRIMKNDADIEYEAQWDAAAATITFDAREGSLGDATSVLEGKTGSVLENVELPTPTRMGYRFVGWYDNDKFAGAPLNELPSAFPAGNTKYYAKYEEDPAQRYSVTYQVQRNEGGYLKRDVVYNYGEVIVDGDMIVDTAEGVRGATAEALLGWQFNGWYKMTPEGLIAIETSAGSDVAGAELTAELARQNLNRESNGAYADTTYVARFTAVNLNFGDLRPYTVEYYLMGDDGLYPDVPNCSTSRTGVVNTAAVVQDDDKYRDLRGAAVTHSDNWPADYDPAFYAVDENAVGRVYEGWISESGETPVLKIYLQKRLAVSFGAGELGTLDASSFGEGAVQEGSVVTYRCLRGDMIPAVPSVIPAAGYVFAGWAERGSDAAADLAAPVSRATAFEARYTAEDAALRFDANGGSAVSDIEGKTGESLAGVALPATERAGYTFLGWFDAEGNELAALPETLPAGETVYTARWEADAATIVFDKNASDATGSVPGRQGTTDAPVNADFPEPGALSRPGYLFAGWNTQADGKGLTVSEFPETFPAGKTVYYAQWKLDVSGLTGKSFSYQGVYDGRAHRIAVPTGLALKEGEQLAMKVNGAWTTNANLFPTYKDVADSASGIEVAILDRDGNQIFMTDTVSVALAPAELTVVTGSVIHPFDGSVATSEQIVVSGLQAGETIGARTTGFASQVGEEVENGFELTWAAEGNSYTAKQGNYVVTAKLGTVKVVTTTCPVTIEGYVGVYDGQEHALAYSSPEAEIVFDADTAYTDAGDHKVGYTVTCPDHGTFTGTVSVNIIPRAITIAVEDSYKIATARDPLFKGAIVEGELVASDDLGTIDFVRTFEGDEVGVYEGGLTARYRQNDNYAVTVIPGTFTIGPAQAGGAGSVNQYPLQTPGDGNGSGVTDATVAGTTVAGTPLAHTSTRTTSAAVTTLSAARELLEAARPASMADLAAPVYADVIGDDATPMVTRRGGETIEDDPNALGAFDEPHCWVHWVMALGILLTIVYAAAVALRRLGCARRAGRLDDDLTGGAVAEEASTERAAQHLGA